MRVAFVATTLVTGGAERVTQHLAMALADRGLKIEFVVLREPGAIGVELQEHGLSVRSGWTGAARLDPLLIPRLASHFRSRRLDAIYFLDHAHAVFHGILAADLARVPVRVMPVHTTGQWNGAPSLGRPIRLVRGRLDRIIAIADAQRDYLTQREGIPASQLVVIPNGIPIDTPDATVRAQRRAEARTELGVAADAEVVLITAVLRPEKNHELLLQAFAAVARGRAQAQLWIMGNGPRREALEALSREFGLAERVRFLGHRGDARRVAAGADIATLTSHPRVETLPLALLEAMDAGLPVVATRVGALAEMVEEGVSGELVEPGDVTSLAARLLDLLADPARRARYGARGQEIVRARYSVERMTDSTEALLRSLRAQRGPQRDDA